MGAAGCTPADHTETAIERDDDASTSELTSADVLFMASLAHEPLAALRQSSWRLDEASGTWRVPRCDLGAQARALARAANDQ